MCLEGVLYVKWSSSSWSFPYNCLQSITISSCSCFNLSISVNRLLAVALEATMEACLVDYLRPLPIAGLFGGGGGGGLSSSGLVLGNCFFFP